MADTGQESESASRVTGPVLLGAFALGLVASSLLVVLSMEIAGVDAPEELSLGWLLVAQLGLWGGMLGLPWFVARINGQRLVAPRSLIPDGRDVGLGVVAGVGMQLVVIPIVYLVLFRFIDDDELSEAARELTDRADDAGQVAILLLIAVIGAPIVEEIFHRGLVQPRLIARLAVPGGIGVGALFFGASHVQLLQLPALVLFGIVLGALAQWRGSLGSPIVAHMAFNAVAVATLLLFD